MRKNALLYGIAILVVLTALTVPALAGEQRARNVIFIVGDGMGPNHLVLLDHYYRRILKQEITLTTVMNEGTVGWMLHTPASGLVTDSAAGATAFSTGKKTLNRRISVDADGNRLDTFLEIAQRNGKKTGVVTTVPPFDATEAAFTAHAMSRYDYREIVQWTFKHNRPDIVMGAVFEGEADNQTQADITRAAEENGYNVATTKQDLQNLPLDKKIYGNFTIDVPYRDYHPTPDGTSVRLADMARAALDYLSRNEAGFFLLIENEGTDESAHANDAGSMLRNLAELDRAIAVAFDFAKKNPDTLLVITADHDTGGGALIGGNDESLALLGKQKEPLEVIKERLGDNPTVEAIRAAVKDVTEIEINEREAEMVKNRWRDFNGAMGEALSNYNRVRFNTTGHSANPVPLVGYGPGSQRCNGWRDNTDVFDIMMNAAQMAR